MTTQPPTLLTLPRELRDLIHTHLFAIQRKPVLFDPDSPAKDETEHEDSSSPLTIRLSNSTDLNLFLPPIAKTCRQLYWESVPLWLGTGETVIALEDAMSTLFTTQWLDTFDGDAAWKRITALEFNEFTTASARANHCIIAKCANLRKLSISLRTPGVLRKADTSEAIFASCHLNRVLEIPLLEKLVLRCSGPYSTSECRRLEYGLRARFVNEWNARGRGKEGEGREVKVVAGYEEDDDDFYDSDEEFCCFAPFD